MNLPNALTFGRIALILPIALLFFADQPWARWLALVLFAAAAATDWLDGYLARRMQAMTTLGRMLDPIADKLLVTAALLLLVATGTIHGWSVAAALAILLREIAISGLREHLGPLGITVPVTNLAKWKTAAQLVALGTLIAPAGSLVATAGIVMLWIAAILTLATGWNYLTRTAEVLEGAATPRPEPQKQPPGAPDPRT